MDKDKIEAVDRQWMQKALEMADKAQQHDEVPVGALVVREQQLLASGWNQPIGAHDPSAHAEIVAMRAAAEKLGNYRLPGCTLYVTVEPCTMCVGAIIHSRIERLVFGALEPRAGAVVSNLQLLDQDHYNHRVNYVAGVMAEECGQMMRDFFKRRRK